VPITRTKTISLRAGPRSIVAKRLSLLFLMMLGLMMLGRILLSSYSLWSDTVSDACESGASQMLAKF
jgi:hypothetical protein